MGIANVISLLSGVALFLFGMSLMGDGLKRLAGNRLELILYRLSNTPLKGVLLGTGVTAVIQSSSATSVMVIGFVNSGMMKVRQAIGIVLGSILGTSITGWIICLSALSGSGWVSLLSTSTISGMVAIIGIILRMFSKKQTHIHIGNIMLGFAVLMFGMEAMSGAVEPLRESPLFMDMVGTLSTPLLGILVGVAFAAVLQSASAAIGILQALAMTGSITFAEAFPIILGIAIGSAVPVLLSALGANSGGKRTSLVYLVINLLGVAVLGVLFYALDAALVFPFMDDAMSMVDIAFVNSVFRLLIVLALTPAIALLEKIVRTIVPDSPNDISSDVEIDRLEERFIAHPALAIEQSRQAINQMARRAQEDLTIAFTLLDHYSDEGLERARQLEDLVDRYEDKLGTYLVKLTGREMTGRQNDDVTKFLHTISDFERISDHARDIAETALEIHEKDAHFSDAAQRELRVITAAVTEIVSIAFDSFIGNDLEHAYRVEPLEELIDNLCDEMKLHHVERLQSGVCTLNQGFIFNDLMTNYERVADHCSNIAVAMIELAGGSFDTHEYLSSLRELRSHRFDHYFREYSTRYHLD